MSFKETFLISPLAVRGCQLWFDASDPNANRTLLANGTAVATWYDKSPNGYSVSQTTSGNRPIFTTAAQNSLPGIQFQTNTFLSSLSVNMPRFTQAGGAGSVFIAARNASTNAGWNIVNTVWFDSGGGDSAALRRYHFSFNQGSTAGTTLYVNNGANFVFVGQDTGNAVSPSANAILGFTISSSFATINTNGNSVSYTGYALQDITNNTGLFIFGDNRNNSGVGANIMIFEMVGFNTQLTTSDRQKIEGYLAWKWGLTSNLPSTHPYKNSRPLDSIPLPQSLLVPARPANNIAYTLFRPTNLANCSLWLDGADVSTMFQDTAGTNPVRRTGSTVALWRDKSVSANHASNTTAQPTVTFGVRNGFNVVNFNGAQYLTLSTTTLPTGSTQCSFFFVTRTTSTGVQVFFTYGANPNNTNQNPQFYYGNSLLATDTYGASGLSDNTNYLNSYVVTSCTFTTVNAAWDNGSPFSGGTTAVSLNTGTGWASIGVGRVTSTLQYYLTGQIGEIIVYNRALSTADRQLVEGYLAWKWGLQTNLPSTHLYRQNPSDLPAVAPVGVAQVKSAFFSPRLFSGLQLWLDAGDRSTITAGATITGWTDKSGNGKTVTFVGTNNTYDPVAKSVNTDNATTNYFYANVNLKRSVTPFANVFIVYTWLGSASNTNQALWGQDIGGGWNRFQLLSFPTNTNVAYGLSYTPSSPNVILVNGLNTANRLLYCANYRYLRTNGTFAYVNGTVTSSPVTEVAASPETSTTNTYFGTIDTGYSGKVAFQEILIYTTDMSEVQRQSIEGYLAWKWGLVANLPSTHPYKLFPPSP